MEVVVGVFMVMVLFGLACFTVILSKEAIFTRKDRLEVVFQNVMGLRDGDNVVARGMPVGKVKTLELEPDGVHVIATLDKPIEIRTGHRITIVSTSILGGRYMDISEGDPGGEVLDTGTVFDGVEPYDLISDAAELINTVKSGFVEGGVIDGIRKSTAELQEIVARVNAGKGTLGRLLSEDDSVYRDLSASVASLRSVAERLETGKGTLGRLLAEDDQLYEDFSEAVGSLKNIAGRIENGEGMFGRLVNDEGLYEQIEDIVEEARAALDDVRETSPVVTFTSIFFGAF